MKTQKIPAGFEIITKRQNYKESDRRMMGIALEHIIKNEGQVITSYGSRKKPKFIVMLYDSAKESTKEILDNIKETVFVNKIKHIQH